jgi:hypothetical protein
MFHHFQQRLHHFRHVAFMTVELGEQLSAFHVLHQQKDMVIIAEVAVQLDDVGVVQLVQQLYLGAELRLHAVLSNRRFADLLECKQQPSLAVTAQVNLSELARPH